MSQADKPAAPAAPRLAYRADPAVSKPAFVEVLLGHQEADRIVQGQYWERGKGCAVGCGIHSVMALTGRKLSHSDHGALAAALGANETLMRLQDRIFEGLPAEEARLWPVRFAQAIPDGADLDGVWPAFAPLMLRRMLARGIAHEQSRAAVERVAAGYETAWRADDPSAARSAESAARSAARSAESAARSAAWSAARSAARSAESAAWSAAESAESAESAAWSAAWSAESAWSAARSAARSAESAARSAAWSAESAESAAWSAARSAESAEYRWLADTLCELLAAAPVRE